MSFEKIIFYLFATILVICAGRVVTARNPVHAALSLVLAFFTSAALWLLLEAEFLAMTLVLVYVGAVMVLFLFVVMMLDVHVSQMKSTLLRHLPLGLGVATVMLIEMGLVVRSKAFSVDQMGGPIRHEAGYSNTAELGSVLYTEYVYPFELAAVILVLAIIAAIALTLRHRPETKFQDPAKQVAVRSVDRVRIVKMKSEKRS